MYLAHTKSKSLSVRKKGYVRLYRGKLWPRKACKFRVFGAALDDFTLTALPEYMEVRMRKITSST